eukprot:Seg803.4 transcript_id=Seg803.4/GoldUCD/mRNA.D3Y31 product="hypothetical protein" protein_id=Seg803.4/GoldUCD/D3Y31
MNSPTSEDDDVALREKIEKLKRKNKKKLKQESKKKKDDKGSKKISKEQKKSSEKNANGVQQPILSDVEVFSDDSPATDSSESKTRPRSDSVKFRKRTGSHKRMGNANWEGRMSRDFTEEMFKNVDLVGEMVKLRDGVQEREAEENEGTSKYEEIFSDYEVDEGEFLQKDEFGNEEPQTPTEDDNAMTVEDYLQRCEGEDRRRQSDAKLDTENTVDMEGTSRKEPHSIMPEEDENVMTVEDYLQQCENEDHRRKSDVKLEKAADLDDETSRKERRKVGPEEDDNVMTVEEYLQQCENEDHRRERDFKLEETANLEEEPGRKEHRRTTLEEADVMTVEEYLKQYEDEDDKEKNDSLPMISNEPDDLDNRNQNDDKLENFSLPSLETKDENFEEDASDYLSVASNRYSSFESLDDAKIKREMSPNRQSFESKQRFDRDRMNSDGPFDIQTERKRRLLESEADRTEDEYLTAEERSVISVSESRNMSISTEIDMKERPFENETDRTEDEYLTADEQSVIWADERREDLFTDNEDREFDDGSRKTSILTNDDVFEHFKDRINTTPTGEAEAKFVERRRLSHDDYDDDDDDVGANENEDRFLVASSRGDFVETKDDKNDQIEEGEDDRNTIVGSDDAMSDNLDVEEDDEAKSTLEDKEVRPNVDEDNHSVQNEETQAVIESIDKKHEVSEADEAKHIESSAKMRKRKTSFFSSMMVKKEMKYAERFAGYDERHEIATKGIEDAKRRFAEAKSNLPLMIVEQRVPKLEMLERLNFKLNEMQKRLETVQIFNRRTNDYIQRWRTIDGNVQEKRIEVAQYRRKTSEKQKLLMACKKRHGFLHSCIIRQEDLQQQSIRRIAQLTDRLDMLKLRQTEQRNIVNRRIEQAKKSCEASVRAAARVVVTSKRMQMLKEKQRELEEKVVKTRREMKKLKKDTKEKEFDLERTVVQKSVKAMKKERGW